jgi:hypothetical protein
MADIVRLMQDPDFMESCMLQVGFGAPGGANRPFVVRDANVFSDFDEGEPLHGLAEGFGQEQLRQLLGEVQELLDRPAVWAAVSTLAEVLVQEGEVRGMRVAEIIQRTARPS